MRGYLQVALSAAPQYTNIKKLLLKATGFRKRLKTRGIYCIPVLKDKVNRGCPKTSTFGTTSVG
jgi:hypothetical protein